MAQAPIKAEMVTEAGIAAHLAANPNLLPPEISELSDQAAIFASNNTNAFMFTGSADADSENTNFGESLATKAIENVLRLEAERRKEDDPDASIIAEAGAAMREDLLEMQTISVGGVSLTLEEWDAIAEALDDPAIVDAVSEELRAQGKTQAEINEILYLTRMAASIAQKEARGIPLTAEEQAVKDRLDSDPDARAAVRTGTETVQRVLERTEADMTPEQQATQANTGIVDGSAFVQATRETVDRSSIADRALEVRNGESVTVRDGQSVASSVSPESMFNMAAYSPSEEFNLQGLDGVQVAMVEPVEVEQNQTQAGPVLGIKA